LLRTFLYLSRVSYLPTVWSNCLAGMWLGGGGDWHLVPYLLVASTFIFLGGSFLKEACSAGFDSQHRRWRPIAAGHITVRAVFLWAWYWLILGVAVLFWLKPQAGILGMALGACMLGYAAAHRALIFSPFLLGLCRLGLYLVGASIAVRGVTGWAIWGGLVVAVYTAGVKCFWPGAPGAVPRRWAILLLGVPLLLAFAVNGGEYREAALLLSLVLCLWVIRCLRHSWWSDQPDYALTSSGLVAGTVLVDWLAVAAAPKELSVAFIVLFVAALGLQRVRPAVAKSPA
jgi:4-hydroxybenzoate polyprenyltransferase